LKANLKKTVYKIQHCIALQCGCGAHVLHRERYSKA